MSAAPTYLLSICVPVYNRAIGKLVARIKEIPIPVSWELLIFDDGSEDSIKAQNQSITDIPELRYEEMPSNLGRSAIRNKLAEAANGAFLLFLDDDCTPLHADFFRQYLHASAKADVLCGGHVYPEKTNKGSELHHFVGKESEVKSASVRNQHPYSAFHSSNFFIKRSLFLETKFDERLKQYGHEDTLFGFELGQKKAKLKHLDNPVLHEGIQSNQVFLEKTDKAVENLVKLYTDYPAIRKEVKLLSVFQKIKRSGNLPMLKAYYGLFGRSMRQQLLTGRLNLNLYKRYKLAYFASYFKKPEKD